MSERLLTILQLSDLHIGKIDPSTGNAALSPAGASFLTNCTYFDGVLGHHARALQDLEEFYSQELVKNGENPLVVVTGDLTRVGHGDDFQAVSDFLGTAVDLNPPHGNLVGLYHTEWKKYTIPGNHDHWCGKSLVWDRPTAAFHNHFPATSLPFVRPVGLSNGRELQLIAINTDTDVHPFGRKRLQAVGSFQSQLATIAPRLGQRQDQQIRVLLMHHSWHKRGAILSIDQASRAALDHFLVDHGIHCILTGHIHRPLVRIFVPNVPRAREVLECRSGTTTQSDQVPYSWRSLMGQFPNRNWPPNTLLVHRLCEENGRTRWYVETFVRTKSRGFVTTGPTGQYDKVV